MRHGRASGASYTASVGAVLYGQSKIPYSRYLAWALLVKQGVQSRMVDQNVLY